MKKLKICSVLMVCLKYLTVLVALSLAFVSCDGGNSKPPPNTPPTPTNVSASASTNSLEITVSWYKVSSDNYSVTGYYVYRGSSNSGPFTMVGTVTQPSSSTSTNSSYPSYTDKTGLTGGTIYYYRVTAYNSDGESAPTPVIPIATYTPSTIPPTPTNVRASASANSPEITVRWNMESSGNYSVDGYYVYRGSSDSGSFTMVGTDRGEHSYTDNTGLTGDTIYYYRVSAYNSDGESKPSPVVPVTTSVPATPTTVVSAGYSSSSINVKWNRISNAAGYCVYRSSSYSGPFIMVATVEQPSSTYTDPSYTDTDTGLYTSYTYYYRVAAYNIWGEGAPSLIVSKK